MLLLRDYGTMRLADVLMPAIGYAQNGHPLVERANATIGTVGAALPRPLADLGGRVPSRRKSAADRHPVHQHRDGRDLRAHPARGRERRRRSHQADRARPRGLVARVCRRGDRHVLPHAGGHGYERRAPPRRAYRRRHGALAAPRGAASDARLWPLYGVQGRALVAGSGDAAAARAAQGVRPRRRRSDQRGFHPHGGRVLETRVRRPRHILRRSEIRRCAVVDTPFGAV